jgi:hypothetical protein
MPTALASHVRMIDDGPKEPRELSLMCGNNTFGWHVFCVLYTWL